MERIIKVGTLVISWNRIIKIGKLVGTVVGIEVDAVLELEIGLFNGIEVRAIRSWTRNWFIKWNRS